MANEERRTTFWQPGGRHEVTEGFLVSSLILFLLFSPLTGTEFSDYWMKVIGLLFRRLP
jgi:hypothetical protein